MPGYVICSTSEFDAGPGGILAHTPAQQFPLSIWVPGPISYSRGFYSWSWAHRQIYYGSVPELRFAFHVVANGINKDLGEFEWDGSDESTDLNNAYYYLLIGKDPQQQSDLRSFWCQVSTAGAYGAFYSDPYNAIFQDGNTISELLFPVKSEGVNPGLPNGVPSPSMGSMEEDVIEDDMGRYLTFIGINGP